MHILVADPEWTSREALCAWLRGHGCDVIAAQDPQKAWKVITSPGGPRLCLLDFKLARDGLCLPRRIRADAFACGCYIVLLSSAEQPKQIAESFRDGADDCITKPVNKTEVLTRVDFGRRVLELQDALRAG